MTIGGWCLFGFIAIMLVAVGAIIFLECKDNSSMIGMVITVVVTTALIFATYGGIHWYYNNTESGKRSLVNQKSEFGGGLERTINICNANGDVMRTFTGKIDIENKEGGYLLFDYNGKRYTYYNCFVESIAEIEDD